jgi:hypothetical protein
VTHDKAPRPTLNGVNFYFNPDYKNFLLLFSFNFIFYVLRSSLSP